MNHNKHRPNGILMLVTLALLGGLAPRAGATDYTTTTTGDWALTNTWGGSGPPSSAADTGLVQHGIAYQYLGGVLATTNLGTAGDYATITVATNGWVSAISATDVATTIANPVIFDGGRLGSGRWHSPGGEWTGPITLTTNGLIVATGRNGSPKLSGKVSGPGGITLTTPDVLGSGGLTLNNPSNDFAGSVVVTQGWLTLACDHALPTGKVVNVYSAGKVVLDVSQTYASEPPPIVNLYGGGLGPQVANAVSVTNGLAVNVSAAGGTFNGGKWDSTGSRATGPIAIAAGGTLHVDDSRGGSWVLDGPISGAGTLRFFALSGGTLSVSVIAGTNNTHSGGTLVATFGPTETHTTIARTEGSLGTGPVTVETNTIMALDKTVSADWTLTNTLAGAGTFKVEDGSATYRLTAGGTVSPGTNTGHVAILRVDGKLAFGQDGTGGTPAPQYALRLTAGQAPTALSRPNPVAAGVSPAGPAGHDASATSATLAIDVASAGATPGVNHDQLKVDHGDTTLASSITNCALVVSRVPTPSQLNGQTLTIVSAAGADFSSNQFASVTGLGAGGSVVYGNGSIAVTWTVPTPIINNGPYANLSSNVCDVSGYLSSTGASPTVVRCYWGPDAMDQSGWAYTNDLGTQAIGTVGTSLTGLTSTVTYYYRFYATNDVGEYWSVATSNFITLGDVNWNDAASGNWNADNANTWGQGTGVYPYRWLNDHVTIDSHTVTLKNSLTTAGGTAPAEIALASNGTLQAGTAFTTYSIDSPVTFNGGTVYGGASGFGLTFNGPVTMQGTSTADVNYLDAVTFRGPISGEGNLVAYFRHPFGGVTLANENNTNWTGTLDITGTADGSVAVSTNRGLGRATANVYRRLSLAVSQNYGANPKPVINVYPGGGIYFGSGSQTIASDIPVFMRGGAWSSASPVGQWYNNCTQSGPVTLVSNTVVGCGDYSIRWNFTGPIDGPGQFILQSPGAGYGAGMTTLSGTNTYAGGTWVQSGLLVAKNTNAFGSGPVQVDYNTNAASHGVIQLAAATPSTNYWMLANDLAGDGTIQVEDGAGTNTLTVLGAVSPGTNSVSGVVNGAGILRMDGSVALGAGSRVRIDITGANGVAGVDFDRLLVDHDLAGLANAVLEVNVSPTVGPGELAGQELIVISNATALADTFAAVVWNAPWGGVVKVNEPDGTVTLTTIQQNPDLPYVRNQAATGVVETAAWLNGTVTATGTSETVVWVFWGQTSGGTNAGAWAASTNLGACASAPPAEFSFEATGLVSGRTYVYRYFVENASGGTWSPTESSFRTFGPPEVDNAGGATAVRGTSATLNGAVTAGRPNPDVYICWGTNDAGIVSTGDWAHVESLGALDGAFARAIGGLTPGQTYFYRCYATNSYGDDWADTAATFTTRPYDDFTWRGLGADNNWTTPANWDPSSSAPTQTWEWAMFEVAAPRQPMADRSVGLSSVQVTGTNGWTWSGAATVTVGRVLDYGSSGTSAWNAALAGAGGVTVSAGQLTLANTNNAFTGETWVQGGRLHAAGRMGAGVAGVLGAAATPIRLGDTNGAAEAVLSFANGGVAVGHDRAITVEAGSTGKAVLWSLPGAGGQTLGGALTLGKDTEFRTEGSSALTLAANPSGSGALIKSGAQPLVYPLADAPLHTGGTRLQGGLLQWAYTLASGSDTTLRFGGGAGLLTLDGGQFELKGTEDPGVRLTLDNPVRVTTNGGALAVWRSEVTATTYLPGALDLGGPLTVGSLTAGSQGALSYRGAITLDQAAGGTRALFLNHTGSDVEFRGAIADGAGTNGLPLRVGIVAGGATASPFRLSGTNATYAGGTIFTGGRVTLTQPRAVGPGALTLWTNAICHLARTGGATNWAFAQDLAGSGTIQVEAGTNSYQLLSLGSTVSPGLQAGAAGTLTIAGRYAFGTNTVGQASLLSIDLLATSTNVADAQADLLRVDHGDAALETSLAQCDLVVNLALAPSVGKLQGRFTILTNTYAQASFTNQAFRSVTVNGGVATVRYATGYVALDVDIKPVPTGALLIVR